MLIWILPVFSELIFTRKKTKNNLLLIYDLETQPFSVGDLLIYQILATIAKDLQKYSSINLAIIFNEKNPTPSDKAFKSINKKNFRNNLISLLPIPFISNYIDELHIFNSKYKFQNYLSAISEDTETFPSGLKFKLTREYLYYSIFDEMIFPYYLSEGKVPELIFSDYLNNWAKLFFNKNGPNKVPITVNLRNNKFFQEHRNSDFNCWLEFFKYANHHYGIVQFFIICAESEIDQRFRELTNVTIVKDLNTRLDEELALIKNAAIHLGASSGPALAAWFGSKPYLIMNTTLHEQIFSNKGLVVKVGPGIFKFCFANNLQRFVVGSEKLEVLILLFEECLKSVSVSQFCIDNFINEPDELSSNWLR